jgi:alcohol dehydrogenase class IV
MDYTELVGQWSFPTQITAGAGSLEQLHECCSQLGVSRPLLVTDPGLAQLPIVEQALGVCRQGGSEVGLFHNIKPNPCGENVDNGVQAYIQGDHDGVIGFGGGSAIDASKAIALMVGQDRPLWDFDAAAEGWQQADSARIAPLVAVPTTAGTGSEVGRAALITNEQRRVKTIIYHPMLLPGQVLLDPRLTTGLPGSLTAATGMDALSHNLEALCSNAYHPMSEGIAVEGIRLVKEYLPRAVTSGDDLTARMQMLVASSMGATAFQKGLGAMHALAHPLGALYDAHHGMLNAILMPYVLVANRPAISERIERLSRYLDLEDSSFDGFLRWVLNLRERLGIPHALSGIGIDDAEYELVGRMATEDPTAMTNPVSFSAARYSEIFQGAVSGSL